MNYSFLSHTASLIGCVVRGASVFLAPVRPAYFLLFLFPPWLDASENLSSLLNIAICPEPNLHASNFLHRRCGNSAGRYMPLKGNHVNAELLSRLTS
jgi:hypothetical protein